MLAGQVVAAAAPDGYTLMLGASTHVTQRLIQPSPTFDSVTSIEHIIRLGVSPSLLVTDAKSPYVDIKALVAAAKAAPGKLNYSSGGIGSAVHLAATAFAISTGIDVVHVFDRGAVEIVPSITTGNTQFAFPVSSTAIPQVEAGVVRVLATTGAHRLPQLPQVPTLSEALGNTDLVLDSWSGLWAPARTRGEIIAALDAAAR